MFSGTTVGSTGSIGSSVNHGGNGCRSTAGGWTAICGAAIATSGGFCAVSHPQPPIVAARAAVLIAHFNPETSARMGRGKWQHHLIDPRTGDPVRTDLLTATVIAPTLSLAEMAAKVILILGAESGLHWLADQPNMAGLLVHRDGQIIRTPNVDRYCWQSSMSANR